MKEKDLKDKEAELKRREQVVKFARDFSLLNLPLLKHVITEEAECFYDLD